MTKVFFNDKSKCKIYIIDSNHHNTSLTITLLLFIYPKSYEEKYTCQVFHVGDAITEIFLEKYVLWNVLESSSIYNIIKSLYSFISRLFIWMMFIGICKRK